MLRELAYQDRVLRVVEAYLDTLGEEKQRADQIADLARQNPGLNLPMLDFPSETWVKLKDRGLLPASRAGKEYSPRHDGAGGTVPNAVLKVPTGGGKTYLAVSTLSRVFGRYLGTNTGMILWIVPNEAIYSQTIRQLRDRQHPYRQILDRMAAGKVRILEKNDPLNRRDVESHLCVMLLMLQSANRQTRETLKMFQDRGDVHGFFPDEGNQPAHQALLERIPNLDAHGSSTQLGSIWPLVKDSLGNALRMIRPVVVLDEGHRAVSSLAYSTLYGFNPLFVLELTATPKDVMPTRTNAERTANILVDVTGRELDDEGMIKMPLNLDARQETDWRGTLGAAVERLNSLQAAATRAHADTGRYIRPILLVQVERTGADQRDGSHIHALDARDWLLQLGFDEAEIAIKTADTNDLNQPENLDLLSPSNRVRAIVTKQALQEGWDCPFAYVLCALAASSNLSGMTQLIGRILRQPHAEKTGIASLDECHVVTHHAETGHVVAAIKDGLEADGLGDLVKGIRVEGESSAGVLRTVRRRAEFAGADIYLPRVLSSVNGGSRPLDYDTDILFALDWRDIDLTELVDSIPEGVQAAASQFQRISLADDDATHFVNERLEREYSALTFDASYVCRMISDIVPNPWVAREIVGNLAVGLGERGFTESRLGELASYLAGELRQWLAKRQDELAEALFRQKVTVGEISFQLHIDRGHDWPMPFTAETWQVEGAPQLANNSGLPLEKSLFAPQYVADVNPDERNVAVYLDAERTLSWWHRNVARHQYALQGWRRGMVYPDFIFLLNRQSRASRIVVLETKGDHLAGNVDTEYKRELMDLLSDASSAESYEAVGSLSIAMSQSQPVTCAMILMSEWRGKLPGLIADETEGTVDLADQKLDAPSSSR